jgi:hypothetical protein
MTPKEKAFEIANAMYNPNVFDHLKEVKNAKRCALIAVDEILNEYWSHDTKRRDWWQEVKQEIEKL